MIKQIVMVTFLALTFGATVWAQDTPNDVRDLVGARAAGGETALKNRGYRFIKTSNHAADSASRLPLPTVGMTRSPTSSSIQNAGRW